MGRPFHSTEPAVGRSTSQIMRMSVGMMLAAWGLWTAAPALYAGMSAVGRSTSQIMRMSVVFPAPFAPSSPYTPG